MNADLYASKSGHVIRLAFQGRRAAYRKRGQLDGADFEFRAAVDNQEQKVLVFVSGTKIEVVAIWLKDNGYRAGEDSNVAILRDMCAAKVIQAFDRGLDFDADHAAFPESFLMITEDDLIRLQQPGRAAPSAISDYIANRLNAAWEVGDGTVADAVLFGQVDALYLNTSFESIERVINLYEGERWTKHANSPLLTPTRSLLRSFVERPATTTAPPATPLLTAENTVSAAASGRAKYDVALSFAGEDRPYVQAVSSALRGHGVSVFYDRDEDIDLWGKNLAEHLPDVYMNQSRLVVLFVSQRYAQKEWTRLESQSAMARALREKREYVLPVRMDDTELPGLLPTISYLDARRIQPEDLAARIARKVQTLED